MMEEDTLVTFTYFLKSHSNPQAICLFFFYLFFLSFSEQG